MASEHTEIEWKGRTGPFSLDVGPRGLQPHRHEQDPRRGDRDRARRHGDRRRLRQRRAGVRRRQARRRQGDRRRPLPAGGRGRRGRTPSASGSSTSASSAQGDLLEPVRDVQASVLIGDVSGIPDDIAAESGWFDEVPSGGPTGAELPTEVRALDRRHARPRRPALPADGHDPVRAADPRRRARGLRRPHASRARARVPAARPRREVQGRDADGEGRPGELPPARQSRWLWQLRIWRCDRV